MKMAVLELIRSTSNEYLQCMCTWRNKKNIKRILVENKKNLIWSYDPASTSMTHFNEKSENCHPISSYENMTISWTLHQEF